jgi:asparagine N-glycosylation enzyme membrane subunit Stt3
LTFARIYFDGVLRATFDPASTEFIRFFDLYPKQGELLTVDVDKGIIATVETLLASPLLFWSIAVMLPVHLIYLSCACITLCSRAILDRASLAALFIVSYYMTIAGGPGDWGRFRHPAMPVVCILAGYGLYVVFARLRPQFECFPSAFAISHLEVSESATSANYLE